MPLLPARSESARLTPEEEARYRQDHLRSDGWRLAAGAALFSLVHLLLIGADRVLLGTGPAFQRLLALRLGVAAFFALLAFRAPRYRSPRAQEAWATALVLVLALSNLAVLASRPRTYTQNVTLEVVAILSLFVVLPDRRLLRLGLPVLATLPGLFFALFLKVHPGPVALISILLAYAGTLAIGGLGTGLAAAGRRLAWKRERELLDLVRQRTELADLRARFITTVSHEFRTPLHTVTTSASILERHRERLDPEQHDRLVARITTAALQLGEMVDEVLQVHHLDAGLRPAPPEDLDLGPWLRDLVAAPGPGSAPVQVEVPEALPARLDGQLLRQVVGNLLGNARKYTPAGGRIHLRAGRSVDGLWVEVEDDGIGIPPDEQQAVFERFHRGSNAGPARGTGLGLSIVREALDLLGGTVDLDSAPGRGTRVRVVLPDPSPVAP